MTKYTAADFANAKFAEHPDGRVIARCDPISDYAWENGTIALDDAEMARDGWVPVPTKPTITESRLRELTEIDRTHGLSVRGVLQAYGVEVIPDPEPTNTDRLEQLIRESGLTISDNGIEGYAAELAALLDEDGVTAPKENN